jgi:prevent-host-death family protein
MLVAMRVIGALQARKETSALLDLVERGEEVIVTRRRKPVAHLVPIAPTVDVQKARKALADIMSMRRGVTLGADLCVRDLIASGRS